ncbi:hypothetical protein Ddye_017744 [Dipteronia dyeriana]|uniref:Reverse transcriptase zinc-binding domain-containing protein n=1 Tax=Dipteronia dyeriana TaxID=168575 RepID=A0AAD9U990_9ROSI|nr:hypothetical protein Ddye_017744 [Dipteronia dyeriana]
MATDLSFNKLSVVDSAWLEEKFSLEEFADDTLVFLQPKEQYLRNARRILRCYELVSVHDSVSWVHDWSGEFSVKSFRRCLENGHDQKETIFKDVWLGICPPNIELFIWQLLRGRVLVREVLSKCGVQVGVNLECPFCQDNVESIDHLFYIVSGLGDCGKIVLAGCLSAELLAIARACDLFGSRPDLLGWNLTIACDSKLAVEFKVFAKFVHRACFLLSTSALLFKRFMANISAPRSWMLFSFAELFMLLFCFFCLGVFLLFGRPSAVLFLVSLWELLFHYGGFKDVFKSRGSNSLAKMGSRGKGDRIIGSNG